MAQDVLQDARDRLLVEIGWGMVEVMRSLNKTGHVKSLSETTARFDDLRSTGGVPIGPPRNYSLGVPAIEIPLSGDEADGD